MTDEDTASVPVEVRIIAHETVKNRGSLLALVIAELDIAGIVIRLQGVEIHQGRLGKINIVPPQFRAANGKRHAAVLLPPEVMRLVLEMFIEQHMEPNNQPA